MHCRADLDNVLRRSAREKEEKCEIRIREAYHKLLPVLDSLDQAAKHDEGTKVLYAQLLGILSAEGLTTIDAVGKKFDPYQHEALFQVETGELEEGNRGRRDTKRLPLQLPGRSLLEGCGGETVECSEDMIRRYDRNRMIKLK